MKQIICAIQILFYLGYISGITVYRHYCMGESVGLSFFHSLDQKCGKCGMSKHTKRGNDCCNDVQITIKSADHVNWQSYRASCYPSTSPEKKPEPLTFSVIINAYSQVNYSSSFYKYALFLQHRNLRI